MKSTIPTLFVALLTVVPSASASVTDDEFAQLKADLMALMARVETLEAENKALRATAEKVSAKTEALDKAGKKSSWADRIAWKGDFRYRYENIDAERSDTRERNRVRARAQITAKPADDLEIGIGIASGGDDPVSTNQTLGGGGSTKDVRLDLAYFKWHVKPGVTLTGGKIKNPWYRPGGHPLLWDGDLRPEGVALTYDADNYFVTTGINFLQSDTRAGNHRISYGIQGGYTAKLGSGKLTAGVSYFDYGTRGREVFFGDADEFFGNSFTCADFATLSGCEYLNDYEEVELFAQLDTRLGERPLTLFADYVQNRDVDDLDTAWAVGAKLGKASAPNTWELAWIYQDLEADALFGLVTDSDFGGGGTDVRGHVFKGGWAINKKWKISFTYFLNERNMDRGIEEDYDRLQIDTAFKF